MSGPQELEPIWLVSKGHVLAAGVRAMTRTHRRRGLIGVAVIEQPLVLEPCSWVHTIGMKITIDVAYVASDNIVIQTATMKPWRVGARIPSSALIIEAAAGSFERWNLLVGDEVEVRRVER
ncbi:MAG: DUF192 domain-containing protein [Ilumatobacteraceae bacterium]|nr:DUF192 domain-containing protein [Ilumatobacteraceae bacterium]